MGKRSREVARLEDSEGMPAEKPVRARKATEAAAALSGEKKKKKKRKSDSIVVDSVADASIAPSPTPKRKEKNKKSKNDEGVFSGTRKKCTEIITLVDSPVASPGYPKISTSADDKKKNHSSKKDKKASGKRKKHGKSDVLESVCEANDTHQEPVPDEGNDKICAHEEQDWKGLPVPTTEEILLRMTKKRNTFLHGHLTVPLLSGEQLKALDEQSRHRMIAASATLCQRLMHLLHDTIVTANCWTRSESKDDTTTVEEALTNDLICLKKIPLAKQYVEMTLWKRVVQLNRDQLIAASRLGFGKGSAVMSTAKSQGLLLHRDDDPDAEFISYREAHMKTVVERFSNDLEKMRQAEDMDADRVQFLLRCLDSGASLFGNLKCIERRKREQR